MIIHPVQLFSVSLCLGFGALGGGWGMTHALNGSAAGIEFAVLGLKVIAIIAALQLSLIFSAKRRMTYWLLLFATVFLALAWFMAALVLPLFGMMGISNWTRITLQFYFIITLFVGVYRSYKHFHFLWYQGGAEKVRSTIVAGGGELGEKFITDLQLLPKSVFPIYVKGLSEIVAFLVVLLMLIGLNFLKVYPVFSALAMGIPILAVCAYSLCAAGIFAAVANALFRIEKELGYYIRPLSITGEKR